MGRINGGMQRKSFQKNVSSLAGTVIHVPFGRRLSEMPASVELGRQNTRKTRQMLKMCAVKVDCINNKFYLCNVPPHAVCSSRLMSYSRVGSLEPRSDFQWEVWVKHYMIKRCHWSFVLDLLKPRKFQKLNQTKYRWCLRVCSIRYAIVCAVGIYAHAHLSCIHISYGVGVALSRYSVWVFLGPQ